MQIINWHSLSGLPRKLRTPAIVSLLLVLPFVILEVINSRDVHEGFPIVLFGLMWLLPLSFILIALPIVRSPRTESRIPASWLGLLPRFVLVVLIAWIWVGLIRDQLPCFLGTPDCD